MNWNFQEILTKDPSSAWGCDTSGNIPPRGVALTRTCRCTEFHRVKNANLASPVQHCYNVKTQICVTRPQCVWSSDAEAFSWHRDLDFRSFLYHFCSSAPGYLNFMNVTGNPNERGNGITCADFTRECERWPSVRGGSNLLVLTPTHVPWHEGTTWISTVTWQTTWISTVTWQIHL